MNTMASYKYQLVDHKKSVIIYYFVLLSLMLLIITSFAVAVVQEDGTISGSAINGMDMATGIFLFVTGLCSFKEPFGMLIQNGISRKRIYLGRLYATITLAFGMAIIDTVILLIFKSMANISKYTLYCSSLYEQLYRIHTNELSSVRLHVEGFIFDFLFYITCISLGYLITNVFYRVNATGKVLLGAGVPVLLFVIYPIIDGTILNGRISMAIVKGFDFAFGLTKQQPGHMFITSILAFIAFSGLGWLFVRRANIKE